VLKPSGWCRSWWPFVSRATLCRLCYERTFRRSFPPDLSSVPPAPPQGYTAPAPGRSSLLQPRPGSGVRIGTAAPLVRPRGSPRFLERGAQVSTRGIGTRYSSSLGHGEERVDLPPPVRLPSRSLGSRGGGETGHVLKSITRGFRFLEACSTSLPHPLVPHVGLSLARAMAAWRSHRLPPKSWERRALVDHDDSGHFRPPTIPPPFGVGETILHPSLSWSSRASSTHPASVDDETRPGDLSPPTTKLG